MSNQYDGLILLAKEKGVNDASFTELMSMVKKRTEIAMEVY